MTEKRDGQWYILRKENFYKDGEWQKEKGK